MNDNSMYRDAIRKPLVNSLIESEQDSQIPESLLWQLSKEEKAVSLYHFLIDNVQSQGICVKEIDMEGLCSAAAAKDCREEGNRDRENRSTGRKSVFAGT